MNNCRTTIRLISCALVIFTCGAQAATVVWDGSTDMTWSEPDPTSWSGSTYNSPDAVNFAGAGVGTITIASNVTPGNMTFSTGTYTIEGGTISGVGRVDKNSGNLTLSNTNTYSGRTFIRRDNGTITIRGAAAMSPNSTIYLERNTTILLLIDDAGMVNLLNEVQLGPSDTSTGVISQHTIDVRNNGGATTGTVIALGRVNLTTGDTRATRQINAKGSNGYILQFGDVDLDPDLRGTATGGAVRFNPTSASVTITGTIKQVAGDTGASTTDNTLYLGGTASGNLVSGVIADAADYPANPLAQPLNIYKADSSDWTLSGTNTYTGTTTIKGGLLRVTGSLSSGSTVTVANTSGVIGYLGGTGTAGSVVLSGTGGIKLMDDSVGTLTLNGNLDIIGAAAANSISFDLGTGANGTDKITVNGNVTMTNSGAGVITLNQLAGTKINAGTYDLIDATGTMAGLGNFTLATTSAFGNNFALQIDATSKILQLVVTSAAGAPAVGFWKGSGVDNNWSTLNNWATDVSGSTSLSVAPGYDTDVSFYATGAGRLTTGALDADFDINSITYTVDAIANTTIDSVANTLILEASSGTGITVNTPASGSPIHTILADVALARSQTWTAHSNASLAVYGSVSDFGSVNTLSKAGTGTLSLGKNNDTATGLNTYSGATVINEGTLIVNMVTSLTTPNPLGMSSPDPANLLLGNGATLKIVHNRDSRYSTTRGFTLNGTADGDTATIDSSPTSWRGTYFSGTASPAYGTPNQTRTLILTGTHTSGGNNYNNVNELKANVSDNGSGAVAIAKNGIGAWKLTGNSSYSGGTALNQGTLRIGMNDNCLGVGTLTMSGGTLIVDDDRVIANPVSLSSNGTIFTQGYTTPRTLTLTGDISGTGDLINSAAGTLVLSGANSYGGDTIVTKGTIQLTDKGTLPSFTKLYLTSIGTTGLVDLAYIGKQQIGALYIDGVEQPSGLYGANGTTITGTGFLSCGLVGTVLIIK